MPTTQPDSSPDTHTSAIKVPCENCQAPVTGPFCSQCGQEVESTLKYFWTVLLHILDDIFSFDSRACRTLTPLMFKPGFLTNEYIAGKRVHFVPPLRLYLFISIICFLSLKLLTGDSIFEQQNTIDASYKITPHLKALEDKKSAALASNNLALQQKLEQDIEKFTGYQHILSDKKSILETEITHKIVSLEFKKIADGAELTSAEKEELTLGIEQLKLIREGKLAELADKKVTFSNNADGTLTFDFLSEQSNKKLNEFSDLLGKKATKAFSSDPTPLFKESVGKLPQLMFIVLPLFAALLKLMYLFSKRLYMEHLTVALHSHSFIFLTVLIVQLSDSLYDYVDGAHTLLRGLLEYGSYAALIWLPMYLLLMQKRVYKQGWLLTLIKYQVISILYITLLSFTALIAFIWGLTDTQL